MEDRERKKRIVLIGRSAAGKTTLCQRINREDLRYHKTQTVQIMGESMIDTPGEYLERSHYRGALTVISADADVIVLVQDATEDGTMFPPSYAANFSKPAIGVVTKSDAAADSQVERAASHLRMAGAKEIFYTSSVTGDGVEQLLAHLGYIEPEERGQDG